MLKNLHIENIAVIEKTDIDFEGGFNALTGETGAGKSIVIDSINAVLGERTSKELIRAGCQTAEVTALFGDLCDEAVSKLNENGFSTDENGELLIRRVLSLSSGGSVRINGKAATVGILKSIGKALVNIHGQHDNQGLLDPDNHLNYIDRIAQNEAIRESYYKEFKNFVNIRRELSSEETDEEEKLKKSELLKYQISEIENADIKIGEKKELKEKLEIAANYEKTLSALNKADISLSGTDDADGAVSMVRNAAKCIEGIKSKEFEETALKLGEALGILEEAADMVRDISEKSDFSPEKAENMRARLDLLHRIMLKYGDSEEKVLEFLADAKKELEKISLSDKRIAELSDELDKSTERLIACGKRLSLSRKTAAEGFSRDVTEILKYLDMPNAAFEVSFSQGKYTKSGNDIAEFVILTNAGEQKKPLHKIASGGELSRIMLAIKSVLADNDDVDTLIFDEIDTGISGRAAGKVGVQLKKVAESRQVVCVTHLAQIASTASNHLLIEKSVANERTYTKVVPLSGDKRITEIARIMSGTEITENLYNSAKELLDRSSSI